MLQCNINDYSKYVKNDDLIMVVKEITGWYGEILVAMATNMQPTGGHGCSLQYDINVFSKYDKNL